MKTLKELANEMLSYDHETGIMIWKNNHHKEMVGLEAGWLNKQGYRCVTLAGKKYRGHRIMWLLYTGDIVPDGIEIDHIDGNRSNNIFSNLRLATKKQNALNKATRSDNKLGVKGVKFNKDRNKFEAWIRIGGKPKRVGRFNSLEEAATAFKMADAERSGEWQSCRY